MCRLVAYMESINRSFCLLSIVSSSSLIFQTTYSIIHNINSLMDTLFSYSVQNKYVHVILQQSKIHRETCSCSLKFKCRRLTKPIPVNNTLHHTTERANIFHMSRQHVNYTHACNHIVCINQRYQKVINIIRYTHI